MLNKQGDGPHPEWKPRITVNYTKYICWIIRWPCQAANSLEQGTNINKIDKIHLKIKTSITGVTTLTTLRTRWTALLIFKYSVIRA